MTRLGKRCLVLALLSVGSLAATVAASATELLATETIETPYADGGPYADGELPSLLGSSGGQSDGGFDVSLLGASSLLEQEAFLPESGLAPRPEFTPQAEFALHPDFSSAYSAAPHRAELPPDMMRQNVVDAISSTQSVSQERDYHLLPDGLMWHSYLAGPQEPRFSILLFGDDKDGYYWDSTLGGRVGFLRYGTEGAKDPKGWQWDFEGAVITRLNLLEQEDVESMDYRFGTQMTWAEGPWAMKFGYYHISSHVGDEYMIRNPTFERINYVTESLVWALSNKPTESLRVYGEGVLALKHSGGAKRWQFQTGGEWSAPQSQPKALVPFAAAHLSFRESTDYHMATTLQAGWGYQGPESNRRLRFGLQYGKGPTSQFEFFERSEEYLGWGLWFDF